MILNYCQYTMNLIKKLTVCCILFMGLPTQLYAQRKPIDLLSPNGEIKVSVDNN
jgi:hypothetical protein